MSILFFQEVKHLQLITVREYNSRFYNTFCYTKATLKETIMNVAAEYWRSPIVLANISSVRSMDDLKADHFQILADNIPTLCWIAGSDGYIVWYNKRWHDYCGTEPKSMEGWGWQDVHASEELPRVLTEWQHSIDTGKPFEMVFPLRGADGIFRSFLTRIVPIYNKENVTELWLGVNTEITGQIQAEKPCLTVKRNIMF
jgi:PAS domain S-box-containing protein